MALFKIYNNIDSKTPVPGENDKFTYNGLPNTYHKGYMYFDASKNLFYIDLGDTAADRVPLNAWGAMKAYADDDGLPISTTYLKVADAASYLNTTATQVIINTWVADA